jgi:hypothetical protein
MNVSAVPRGVLDHWLRVLRRPANASTKLLRLSDDRARAVEIALDRADATARDVVGRVWRDETLREDARARRAAADERQRALELRREADRRTAQADEELDDQLTRAESLRTDAEQRARAELERVRDEAKVASQKAADNERRGRRASRQTAQAEAAAAKDESRRTRSDQLDRETKVLGEKEKAVGAASEAQRLEQTAAELKSNRKTS